MSFKEPKKLKKGFIPYYPAKLMMSDSVVIKTGPYSKARCGCTQKEVTEFLVHLVEKYEEFRAEFDKVKEDEVL